VISVILSVLVVLLVGLFSQDDQASPFFYTGTIIR
jgi:hypothetical protein